MTANDVLSRFGLRPIAGGEPVRDVSDSEVEYYLRCPFCGQVYDAGDVRVDHGSVEELNPFPGWEELDNNPATVDIITAAGQLFQRHDNGRIFRFTGTPLTGWVELDNNPATVQIVAAGGQLFQRHNSITNSGRSYHVVRQADDSRSVPAAGGCAHKSTGARLFT